MQDKYKYNIIILKNKCKVKKVLFWSQKEETSLKRWNTYSRRKEKVVIHKTTAKYKPVEYDLVFAHQVEENPKPYEYKDSLGRNVSISLEGSWEIVNMEPYKIEEKFKVYGRRKMSVKEIVGYLILPLDTLTSIGIVHNKLIMHNEHKAELILCKSVVDAERLYDAINKITKGRNKNLLYGRRYEGSLMTYALKQVKDKLNVSNRILYSKSTAD